MKRPNGYSGIAMAICRNLLLLPVCLGLAASAQAADGFTLGIGLDHSAGHYGETSQTKVAASVVQTRYDSGAYSFRMQIPYLKISGPASVIGYGDSLQLAPQSVDAAQYRSIQGLGDVVLGATWLGYYAPETGVALDLGGKIKLPTANSSNGLGTGKTDLSLHANAYKRLEAITLMLGGGYKWLGKPAGSSYRNIANVSAGVDYRHSAQSSLGGIVDFRQSALAERANQNELTLYWTYKFDKQWTGQAYVYGGTTDASPERGGGLSWSYRY